jgi:CRISPR/Cas system-associated endoribonuclease Cas2
MNNAMDKKCYIIMYDLRTPGKKYTQLYEAIKSYGIWGRITESTWAIVTECDHATIRNHLNNFIDSNDRLMIIRSGKSAAWTTALANNDWLKNYLVL